MPALWLCSLGNKITNVHLESNMTIKYRVVMTRFSFLFIIFGFTGVDINQLQYVEGSLTVWAFH